MDQIDDPHQLFDIDFALLPGGVAVAEKCRHLGQRRTRQTSSDLLSVPASGLGGSIQRSGPQYVSGV